MIVSENSFLLLQKLFRIFPRLIRWQWRVHENLNHLCYTYHFAMAQYQPKKLYCDDSHGRCFRVNFRPFLQRMSINSHLKYRADIDGLRAIAVLAVVFFHADLGCRGGFVGVDVFFVISGYLITGLILNDFERGEFSLLEFWTRRVLRILPALSLVTFAVLVAGGFFLMPVDYDNLGQSVFAQALLSSNIYFWLHSGYFNQSSEEMPLLHTWSLAVEEQFYLVFPFLLIGLRRFPRHALISILGAIAAVSLGLSVYCSYFHSSMNFYMLPTRAWELLLGALPATLSRQREPARWLREFMGWTGILAIFYAMFFYNRETRFPGITAIPPVAGTALIILANSSGMTSLGRFLSLRPLVLVGLISYSLYLWHWPLLAFARYLTSVPLSVEQRLELVLVSVILAVMSWKWVEIPFRKRAIFKNQARIAGFTCITAAVLLLVSLAIHKFDGVPSRFPLQAQTYMGCIGDGDPRFWNNCDLKQALNGEFVELGSGDKHLPVKLLVWGDSHAMVTLSIVDILCREHSIRGVAAVHFATAPLLNFECDNDYSLNKDCIPFGNAIVDFVRKNHVSDVVMAAVWPSYYKNNISQFHWALLDTVKKLNDSGARVWIMRQVPRPERDVPHELALGVLRRQDPEKMVFSLEYYQEDRSYEDRALEGITSVKATILDPKVFFISPDDRLIVVEGGKSLYKDGNHLSEDGAMKLRPMFEPIFDDLDKGSRQLKIGNSN